MSRFGRPWAPEQLQIDTQSTRYRFKIFFETGPRSEVDFGPLCGVILGRLGSSLGASSGHYGASWGHLKAMFRRLGAILGRSWGVSGSLGPSWSVLGLSWGRLVAALGPSWGCLGPSCSVDFSNCRTAQTLRHIKGTSVNVASSGLLRGVLGGLLRLLGALLGFFSVP